MADDFGNVTVTPPTAPVRDARRVKELVIRLNELIPAVPAVLDEAGAEVTPAVPEVPAGTRVKEIELRYIKFNSTNEHHPADNPGGVVSQGGTNLYKGANADAIKAAIFKAGVRAEIEARLAEDNIDA